MPLSARRALQEAVLTARSSPGVIVTVGAVVACMSAAVLLTAGRAAALERDVLATVDDAGTRTLVLASNRTDGGLGPSVVDRIDNLDGVEWVIGFGVARDVTNAGLDNGRPVASRTVYGTWPDDLAVSFGESRPGAALVTAASAELLGLASASGAVRLDGTLVPVTGQVAASGVLAPLANFVVRVPDPEEVPDPVTLVYIVAESAAYVHPLADSVLAVSGEADRDTVSVATSDRLVELQDAVSGRLSGFSRQLATGALAAGLVLVALSMMMMSNARRRDFGRRRALGASRPALVAVVALTALVPGLSGTVLGSAVGLVALALRGDPQPGASFVTASTVLIVMVVVAGALPGALIAAWRDPATVLRVP